MLTLIAIATAVLIAFGLFVWLQGHRNRVMITARGARVIADALGRTEEAKALRE